MKPLCTQLWHDQRGEANSLAIILITTIVALGAIIGLSTLRNAVVQELGDMAVAIESLNQSFTSSNATFIDLGPGLTDPVGSAPACISLCDGTTVMPEGT